MTDVIKLLEAAQRVVDSEFMPLQGTSAVSTLYVRELRDAIAEAGASAETVRGKDKVVRGANVVPRIPDNDASRGG